MSDEQRKKISAALSGIIRSEETRKKISAALRNRAPIIRTEEWKRKISDAMKGKPCTEEQRRKLRALRKGIPPSNKGIPMSNEQRIKIGNSKRGKPLTEEHKQKIRDRAGGMTGKHHSPETCLKISIAHKGKKAGERNPAWKGGISFEPYCIKFNDEFKERVRAFFDYKCVECGEEQSKKKLDIHHVNFRKDACCAADVTPLFVPLCQSCHGKTNHNRIFWQYWFTQMIDRIYGGKCYFNKEEMEQYTFIADGTILRR
jgi:hypothetical protein